MSSRSTRTRHINRHLEAIKLQQRKDQQAKLTICLHVKETSKKGKSSALIPLQSTPFSHALLQNITTKKKWPFILNLIESAVETTAFKTKFGQNSFIDKDRGVLGWMGSRDMDESPCYLLRGKAPFELQNNEQWEAHSRAYRSKNESETDKEEKFWLLDLGIAVYDKEKEDEFVKKQVSKKDAKLTREKRKSVVSPTPAKKPRKTKKKEYIFKAPHFLSVEVVAPIEHDTKKEETKTSRIDPLGTINIDFSKFVLNEDEENESISDDSDDALNEIINLEKKDSTDDDVDDAICQHIYEPIKNILAHALLSNNNGEYSKYINKIGSRVSSSQFYFIFQIRFLLTVLFLLFLFYRVVYMAIVIRD